MGKFLQETKFEHRRFRQQTFMQRLHSCDISLLPKLKILNGLTIVQTVSTQLLQDKSTISLFSITLVSYTSFHLNRFL